MIKLLSIFTIILFSSCNPRNDKIQNAIFQGNNKTDTLIYSYTTHKDISSYLVENDEDIDTAYYQISYPVFADSTLNDVIHPYILIDGDESVETATESFIWAFNEFVEESSTQTITFPWYKNVKSEVWTNTPLFLTLATAVDEYTGGAHGNHYTVISNIDIQSKKKIEIKDIIEKEKIVELTKIAEVQFRKNENLSDSASLEKDFFFENGTFDINENFGLTKSSFIIYFNEYEIRPYAEGPTLLEIPYSDIENILNSMGKKYVNSIKQSLN
jgi:hypothetical protein